MILSRLPNLAIALGAVLLLTFLFVKTRAIDFEVHNQFIGDVRRLKALDATLNQDVLKSRYGQLTHYDPLVTALAELKRLQNHLQDIPPFIDKAGQIDIQRRLDDHAALLAQKESLLERFKSRNAVLNNSLSYFPIITTELLAQATSSPSDRELAAHLENLLREVLIYNLTSRQALGSQIQTRVEMILSHRARHSPSVDGADLDIVIAHVKTILKNKPQVDAVTTEILVVPTSQANDELYAAYNQHYEQALRTVNRYRLYLSLFSVMLLGYIAYIIVKLRNITRALNAANASLEQRVQERTDELLKSNAELENARDKAIQANQAKSAFVANMSHEIRTPMNAILGFAEILNGLVTDPQQKEYLSSIDSSGKSLLTLINDILDLSKVEAGKLKLEYTPMNPRTMFEEIESVFSQRIAEKGLALHLNIDDNLPQAVTLDETRLRQILLNLIGNAVKFTDDGYVKLSVHHRYPEADKGKLDLIFAVQDTGIGIPEDQRELIFGAFEQQRGQSINEYSGTGLGLAITKRLVEIMGGEIVVTSEVGVGSTFTVQFKNVELATIEKLVKGQQRDIDPDTITFEGGTILIADDVQSNRQLIEGYLSPYPFTLIEAENGQTALEATKRQGPDLVLMDMRMPVMDGYEATRRIKGDAEIKTIPVVALTASAMKADQAEITRLCDGYLIKPIKKVELIGALAKFLPHLVEASASIEVERSQAAPEDKLAPETLEAETLEKLPELVSILQEHLETQWEFLKQTSVINEVEAFGVQMRDLGNQYNYPPLIAWGERLSTQAQMFKLDVLPTTLDEFPRILEQIQLLTEA